MANGWHRCSACKREIGLGAVYWVCSVSTCNRARTALFFCSVDCWEIHLPTERHRDAWAVEKRAPTTAEPSTGRQSEGPAAAARTRTGAPPTTANREPPGERSHPTDVLVVVSKLKAYVRAVSGFNTSDRVALVLSDRLRRLCDESIRSAKRAGRETLLDRDVPLGD